MLDSIITSKTRVRLLLKFFLNTGTRAYLRGLAEEFGDSTNSIRVELNRLTMAGLLKSESDGRTRMYQANMSHPLARDIHSIIMKITGIDSLIGTVLRRIGSLELAFVTGDYAKGKDSGTIELVLVGDIDRVYLQQLVKKAEGLIKRNIRPRVISMAGFEEIRETIGTEEALVIWGNPEGSGTAGE